MWERSPPSIESALSTHEYNYHYCWTPKPKLFQHSSLLWFLYLLYKMYSKEGWKPCFPLFPNPWSCFVNKVYIQFAKKKPQNLFHPLPNSIGCIEFVLPGSGGGHPNLRTNHTFNTGQAEGTRLQQRHGRRAWVQHS